MSQDVKIIKDKRQWVVVAFGLVWPFDRKADAERAMAMAINAHRTGAKEVQSAIKAALDMSGDSAWP